MHGIGDRVNTPGMLKPALFTRFEASGTLLGPERRTFAVISPKLRHAPAIASWTAPKELADTRTTGNSGMDVGSASLLTCLVHKRDGRRH